MSREMAATEQQCWVSAEKQILGHHPGLWRALFCWVGVKPRHTSASFCPLVRCFWPDCSLVAVSGRDVFRLQSHTRSLSGGRRHSGRPSGRVLRNRAPAPLQAVAHPQNGGENSTCLTEVLWALNPFAVGGSPHLTYVNALCSGTVGCSPDSGPHGEPSLGTLPWVCVYRVLRYLYLLRTPSSGQVKREGNYEIIHYC